MPTANDPEKKPQPVKPAAKPAAAKPATAKTVVGAAAAAPTKPGVATKPAAPPKPASKAVPLAKPAQRPAAEEADDEEQGPSLGSSLLKQTPAWAVSMLVHIVALLAMALIVSEPPKKEVSVSIVSSTAEDEENFEEFEEEMPEETPVDPSTDPVADVAVTTDVVVENVQVVSDASDVDAAPLAVELSEFGDITAPASDMLSTIGAVGGTGGGYGGRKNAGRLAATGGGGADTESAVDKALKWFIAHQMPDGGWSFDLSKCPSCQGKCSHAASYGADRCAATAMALLPFFGRGYTHKEGPYKPQLEAGIAFLAALAMKGEGNAAKAGGGGGYSQGLAGIALSEAYAMTQDNRLQMPAQYVLNCIMDWQDPVGGGWNYNPKTPGDTSIVGWHLMALKSGNMAYLEVNPATIKKAIGYLDSVEQDSGSQYGYRGPGAGPATSAVGLLCRMYLGWKKDHPALQRGVERLAKMGPSTDLYFDYYATQIMHHIEGDIWQAWNAKMKELLLKNQATEGHEAGSWYNGVNGGHGAHVAGRLYCTSLATMILEVYYRHLPIYRGQATDDEFKE